MLNIITRGLLSRCIRILSSLRVIKPYTKIDPRYRRYNIGDYTYGYPKIMDWTQKIDLTIGRYCSFAAEVTILLDGEHILDRVSTYPPKLIDSSVDDTMHPATRGAVILGNGVWVGFGAIILSGVKIGNGAVIGAGSVVTRDIPPYGIAAGNPAKILKYRFDENTIENIEACRWWEKEACRDLAEFVKQNANRATHEI